MTKRQSDKRQTTSGILMQYLGLATQWLVMLLVFLWLGFKVDEYLFERKYSVFTIGLPMLALGFSLWRLVSKLNKPGK